MISCFVEVWIILLLLVRGSHCLPVLASDSGDKWLSHCRLGSAVIHVNARPVLVTLTAQRKKLCAEATATLAPLAGLTATGKDVSFMISDLKLHHWRLSDWKIRMTCCPRLNMRIIHHYLSQAGFLAPSFKGCCHDELPSHKSRNTSGCLH